MHVMEISWDDLRTVLAVVRGGTLAKASQALGVNYTTVARRVSRAEAALNRLMAEFRMDPGIARLSERLQQMLER